MTTFATFAGNSTGDTTLTSALLAPNSGIDIAPDSIVLHASGQDAVNFYDGSLGPLGIGAGLLLTSGTTPGTSNTVDWFGADNSNGPAAYYNGDADIDAVVNTVFQTQSYDATTLSFDFSVTDASATSVSFDLVFGSDEYPEWVDQFVDSAVVMVNGVNYALFNHDPMHPLSVVSANLAAGYFQDNAGNVLPIEYDGVSNVLKIVAPILPGAVNHIKIGIADTGDHIYDSGIFIANLAAGTIPGSGVVATPTVACTDNADNVAGSLKDEYFDLKGGDDTAYAGAGDDIVVAGAGNDTVYGGSGADELKGDAGNDKLDGGLGSDTAVYGGASAEYSVSFDGASNSYTVTDGKTGAASEGTDVLENIEFAKFSDGLFSLGADGLTAVGNPNPVPTNQHGLVVISGIGALGDTLTATVSDPNGIPGPVSYQWQVSADNGANWATIGGNSNSYTVSAAELGKTIQVLASYTDGAAKAESVLSAQKSVLAAGGGDLVVTLLQLTAPAGTSTINPLTTLLQNAIELGLSPNTAALTIKSVLGLPPDIQLQTYDAWSVLQGNPNNAVALGVEKVAVQVAILTSLSDDDSGMNLTLAILDAAANNQALNLADVNDLSTILGVPAVIDPSTNKYPQPLAEIFDRNQSMSDAIADGGGVAVIEAQWQDLLSVQDGIASTSIADLSIHVNQAPAGSALATLTAALPDSPYTIYNSDLLQGFSDPDGGALQVSGLAADSGMVQPNPDGTWTFTPKTGYFGPVELTYTVLDGQGGSTDASQLFVVLAAPAANNAPTGSATALLATGAEDSAYVIHTADLLLGFTDADADTLGIANLVASEGVAVDNGDGTWTITPTTNYNGSVSLGYDVVDGQGGSIAATQSYLLAAINDAPTGSASAQLVAGTENATYTVSADELLLGFSDVDGDILTVVGLVADHGTVADNADGSFTITLQTNFSGTLGLGYQVADGHGGALAASQWASINALAGVTLTGTSKADHLTGGAHDDTLYGLAGNDVLDGSTGDDMLIGGPGSDTYVVDSAGDTVVEASGAGTDRVLSSVSHTLGANVENLTLTGTAAIDGAGNGLANILVGNGAANLLDGGSGADKMSGGSGDDTYMVDSTGDSVAEGSGAGNDTVITTLASYSLGANVENLVLGGLAAGSGSGNTLANALWGNDAANVLSGLAGGDMLYGGGGDDRLIGGDGNDQSTGGQGADVFRFDKVALSATGNFDTILDFKPAEDRIELENAVFKKLSATGNLSAANFRASVEGTAADANDYILYDTDSGVVYYDADGSGAGAAVAFVTLVGQPVLAAADFIIT